MEGFKTYRHDSNPKEKELHDKFIEMFGSSMELIPLTLNSRGTGSDDFLSEREEKIVISTIQWLGSPVGQSFLRSCGFELKE